MKKRPLPIGIDDFQKLRENGFYYVDKSALITDLLHNRSEVTLFTRPRRFGKTLNLSMLRYFFEDTGSETENQHRKTLFEGLEILKEGESVLGEMCRYSVIMLTLKSAKQPDWEMARLSLYDEIAKEYDRHSDILKSGELSEAQKKEFLNIRDKKASPISYAKSLEFLSRCLVKSTGRKTIILIDEYDVPLENAYMEDFYEEMAGFIRSLLESALKSNPALEFAVVSGCIRISKESIFTGLNNLNTISVLSSIYEEHFGFTQHEVRELLHDYHLEEKEQEFSDWYDGYLFGDCGVYNPWSVLNRVMELRADYEAFPKPYWSNTSSNSVIKEMIQKAVNQNELKKKIEDLVEGNTLELAVHEEITYGDIYDSDENLWNFLFFTGYLKKVSARMEGESIILTVKIPNKEVKYIYVNTIANWFENMIQIRDKTSFYKGLLKGNAPLVEEELRKILFHSISYYDGVSESFYHGFMMGMLQGMDGYEILSNREEGNGRPDIILKYQGLGGTAVIMEYKATKERTKVREKLEEAAKQIRGRRYAEGLYQEGFDEVICYAIVFFRKDCLVKLVCV